MFEFTCSYDDNMTIMIITKSIILIVTTIDKDEIDNQPPIPSQAFVPQPACKVIIIGTSPIMEKVVKKRLNDYSISLWF